MANKTRWLIGGGGLLVVAVLAWLALRPTPQLGSAPAVYPMVDALYTAVRNQDAVQVEACEKRLLAAHEGGLLPAAAWKTLRGIIDDAKGGKWRSSAESLYEFMRAQRRDGK